jgi:hypothetical protein
MSDKHISASEQSRASQNGMRWKKTKTTPHNSSLAMFDSARVLGLLRQRLALFNA